MTAPAIEFREVTKTYRKKLGGQEVPALTHVSFTVSQGEICAFIGPNGAGKTTSISILMGFLYADWGHVRVLAYEPGDVRRTSHFTNTSKPRRYCDFTRNWPGWSTSRPAASFVICSQRSSSMVTRN